MALARCARKINKTSEWPGALLDGIARHGKSESSPFSICTYCFFWFYSFCLRPAPTPAPSFFPFISLFFSASASSSFPTLAKNI
jgi:hypothetical protein